MTLKEKFTKVEFEKYVEQKDINSRAEFEKIADVFAMEFAKWCFNVVSEKKHKGIDTVKQLLEIYKKEKGL